MTQRITYANAPLMNLNAQFPTKNAQGVNADVVMVTVAKTGKNTLHIAMSPLALVSAQQMWTHVILMMNFVLMGNARNVSVLIIFNTQDTTFNFIIIRFM